jgi:hypothetical protein
VSGFVTPSLGRGTATNVDLTRLGATAAIELRLVMLRGAVGPAECCCSNAAILSLTDCRVDFGIGDTLVGVFASLLEFETAPARDKGPSAGEVDLVLSAAAALASSKGFAISGDEGSEFLDNVCEEDVRRRKNVSEPREADARLGDISGASKDGVVLDEVR